ncbi:hypothetical protein J2Z75_005119 [Rhizobium herbae]|jgi:hypothetical protein|uniref:Uncharacterized protein n=1 Tax=Rhizobium herbae TaxID=508661 RepID=A0ABS4EUJ0_9HYPH|nr:hypothetical protein [Rhizobium herbae]
MQLSHFLKHPERVVAIAAIVTWIASILQAIAVS